MLIQWICITCIGSHDHRDVIIRYLRAALRFISRDCWYRKSSIMNMLIQHTCGSIRSLVIDDTSFLMDRGSSMIPSWQYWSRRTRALLITLINKNRQSFQGITLMKAKSSDPIQDRWSSKKSIMDIYRRNDECISKVS